MEIRKTYRINKDQFRRLRELRDSMSAAAGQKVSWQLVLSSVIETGLQALGYGRPSEGN